MAEFTVQHRKVFPAGTVKVEIARLLATGAVSTSTSLDYPCALRCVEAIEIGYAAADASVSTAAVTFTNAAFGAAHPHATITVSGLAATGNKTVELVAYGRT